MALQYNPKIVTKGLVMNLDTADKNSYPGSGTTWTDLCGNGFNATLGSSVSFQTVHGGVLRTLNSETNTNQKIESVGSINIAAWNKFTYEIWFKNNGSQGSDCSAFGFDNGSITGYGARYQGSQVQTWINGTLDFGLSFTASTEIQQIVITGDGQTFKLYKNSLLATTQTADVTNAGPDITRFHMNSDTRTSSNNGYNGDYAICRMYNEVLTPTEIKQNYDVNRSRFGD